MQMKIDPPGPSSPSSHGRHAGRRGADRSGPHEGPSATTNRMPARVLIISLTLTAALFAIGYLWCADGSAATNAAALRYPRPPAALRRYRLSRISEEIVMSMNRSAAGGAGAKSSATKPTT